MCFPFSETGRNWKFINDVLCFQVMRVRFLNLENVRSVNTVSAINSLFPSRLYILAKRNSKFPCGTRVGCKLTPHPPVTGHLGCLFPIRQPVCTNIFIYDVISWQYVHVTCIFSGIFTGTGCMIYTGACDDVIRNIKRLAVYFRVLFVSRFVLAVYHSVPAKKHRLYYYGGP